MNRKTALKLLLSAMVMHRVRAQESHLTTTASTDMMLKIPEDYTVSFGSLKRMTFEHGKRSVTFSIDELMAAIGDDKK